MKPIKTLFVIMTFLLSAVTFAKSKGVAKVIQVRGKVYNVDTKKRIKKNQWVKEGATILTKKRSFVKLLFIDKSKMSLGPTSKMKISKFPKNDAGIISLMKGQLRSKVTKNYLEMKKREKSKLFIKTKTAAMGVRGTDFQVNYNPINENTSLITFEGRVLINSISREIARSFSQSILEDVVSAPTAVAVTKGQFSGVLPKVNTKPLAPVKINSKQLESLEKNDGSKDSEVVNNNSSTKKKTMATRSILPPGVKGSEFAGASKDELINQVANVDKGMATAMTKKHNEQKRIKKQESLDQNENFSNSPSMSSGGFVDTANGLYIPPPKNAAIDPITNEVIMPEMMGNFDKSTGEYKNEFFDVNPDGSFVQKDSFKNSNPVESRGPASVDDNIVENNQTANTQVATDMNAMDMIKKDMVNNTFKNREFDVNMDPSSFNFDPNKFNPQMGPDGTFGENQGFDMTQEELDDIAERATSNAVEDVEDNTEEFLDKTGDRTRVKINIRVQ